MLNLYQEILMDHYKNPRNRGQLIDNSFIIDQRNSSCGDEVICSGKIIDNTICAINFNGNGCVISQATASLLSERVKNSTIQDIFTLDKEYLISLLGMSLGPVRMQCALLSLTALQKGITHYLETNK